MKSIWKKQVLIMFVMFTSLFVQPFVVQGASLMVIENIEEAEIDPRADILQWRYKVIGEHLYKRLFNASTGEWVGDWILVQ